LLCFAIFRNYGTAACAAKHYQIFLICLFDLFVNQVRIRIGDRCHEFMKINYQLLPLRLISVSDICESSPIEGLSRSDLLSIHFVRFAHYVPVMPNAVKKGVLCFSSF